MVYGLFSDSKHAGMAVGELKEAGFVDAVSVVSRDENDGDLNAAVPKADGSDAVSGAVAGGALGGLAGVIAGLIAIAVPGVGPLVVAGPLLTSWGVTGAALGALTGGLAGALKDIGIPDEVAQSFENRIKEGEVFISVAVDEDRRDEVEEIFQKHGAHEMAWSE